MVPLWPGPDNNHGFIMDGKSYRQGWTTARTLNEPAVSGIRITTSLLLRAEGGAVSPIMWSSQALFWRNWAICTMSKQKHQQQWLSPQITCGSLCENAQDSYFDFFGSRYHHLPQSRIRVRGTTEVRWLSPIRSDKTWCWPEPLLHGQVVKGYRSRDLCPHVPQDYYLII